MKNKLIDITKRFFNRRNWDPDMVSSSDVWDKSSFADAEPSTGSPRRSRGVPNPSLPLAERLKKVRSDLKNFEESLPDLNNN
jgi:hypothetical protein